MSKVTFWLTTSTGWELAIDVAERDVPGAWGALMAVGTPSKRPPPGGIAGAQDATAPPTPTGNPPADGTRALGEVLDMEHARRLAAELGATRQTQCVAILAFEAERAGVEYLPRVGSKALVEELLRHEIQSSERAMLANTVAPGHFVEWVAGKAGVRLDQAGRAYLAPALGPEGEVVDRQ